MRSAFALHLKHHPRFYSAAALGVLVWLGTAPLAPFMRTLLAGDAFFLAHLLAMAVLLSRSSEATFRHRAEQEDDGLPLIALITIAMLTLSLGSIFALLNHEQRATAGHYALALGSVPLGWLMLHTVWSFHYAHVFHSPRSEGTGIEADLLFPGGKEPAPWDFLYYSFVVGMTAQVSDVAILTPRMRMLTLIHAVVSFFFNTVILAVVVNAAVTLSP
jgi:uncharacterized membrane protein